MSRAINAAGLEIIKNNEGCVLEAYLCPAGVPTIGWGHTGSTVRVGQRITQHQADEILASDLEGFEDAVEALVPGLNDNQFSALVSLIYNIGKEAFRASTMRKRALEGDFGAASAEFPKWCHAGVKVLPGLVRRRAEERALFDAPT